MATQDQLRDDEAEYAAAFDEDMMPPAAAEGEGMGMTPPTEDAPAGNDAATEGEPEAVALVVADADAMQEGAEKQAAD